MIALSVLQYETKYLVHFVKTSIFCRIGWTDARTAMWYHPGLLSRAGAVFPFCTAALYLPRSVRG